jgi:hypothetical protein
MSPGESKPATGGRNRSSQLTSVSDFPPVENSFTNKPMRASCVGLFVKEFSTYVDGVAGSIPPIPGRVIAPPDTNEAEPPTHCRRRRKESLIFPPAAAMPSENLICLLQVSRFKDSSCPPQLCLVSLMSSR